ncbi:MAG: hypothetical protein PHU85_17435 [Phycisphaerae bacterium]|nr:hypothetical protein [Phycisphaerae bacterium]
MRTSLAVLLSAGLLAGALLWVAGCDHDRLEGERRRGPRHDRYESGPRAVIVEPRPTEVIVVEKAPPPMIVERIPSRPSPNHVWIEGYYSWDNGHHRHTWVKGHYAECPKPNARWTPDTWVKTQRGWKYEPGHWN